MELFPFKIIKGENDRPMIQVDFQNEKKTFHPEEISAMILTKMKTMA